MWVWVVVALALAAVAVLYRRSVRKVEREGHRLRGSGDFMRYRREVRRDVEAWDAQNMMGTPPPRRTIGDDRPPE